MKRIALILIAASTFAADAAAYSRVTIKSGSYVHVPAGEVLKGRVLLTGAGVVVDGDVDGDLMAFAAYVEVNGGVAGDLLVAAATVVVNGDVAGKVRCYGAAVTGDGSVAGSLEARGAALFLRGRVGGDVRGDGAATWLGGAFAGDVETRSVYLALEDGARVGGDVRYRAEKLERSPLAAIGGRLGVEEESPDFAWWAIKSIWSVLALFVLAAFVGWLRPSALTAIPDNVRARPLASLLLGLAVFVGVPLAVLILTVTVIGIPAAVILAAFYAMALYAARIFAGVFVGRFVAARVFKGRETPPLFAALVGIIILVLAGNIPYFKILLAPAVWVFVLGAAALYAWEMRKAPARS